MRLKSSIVIVSLSAAAAIGSPATAKADAELLQSAVSAARTPSCEPLRYDPRLREAAEIVLQTTNNYLDFNARVVPISDAAPLIEDLGVSAGKVKLLQGAGHTEADAIKFLIIEGYQMFPDCTYDTFGGAVSTNDSRGYYLTALIMTGP